MTSLMSSPLISGWETDVNGSQVLGAAVKEAEELQGVPGPRCLHRAGNNCSSKKPAHLGEDMLEHHWPEYKLLRRVW